MDNEDYFKPIIFKDKTLIYNRYKEIPMMLGFMEVLPPPPSLCSSGTANFYSEIFFKDFIKILIIKSLN